MPGKTVGEGWDNLFLSFLSVLAFPLLPLLCELIFSRQHSIKEDSVLLAAAMYIIGVGLTSKLRSYFFATVIASILAAMVYGYSLNAPDKAHSFVSFAWEFMVFTAASHLLERYYRHIVMREPFFEWES